MNHHFKKYHWFEMGDINGFFGLISDNMAVLCFMAGILIFGFKFPADVVYQKMIPGTALGVLFGDLVYTWLAFRLAKRTKKQVTAMPLGLDAPSTIGITLAVLGPVFMAFKKGGYSPADAANMTWYVGMATMILIGALKLITSFCGVWIQKIVPRAGLLGSLAGIGLLLIGYIPLVNIFGLPIVGLIALGLVMYTLVARIHLPGKIPGVLAAIVVGTVLYHIMGATGLSGVTYKPLSLHLTVAWPLPSLDFMKGMSEAIKYLPIAIPFALLTVIGGINVTESARVAGDEYNTRSILLTEAFSTLVAGLLGGVAQSTPYIGQPAYKRMGARAGYTLLTGLFIGLGGVFGYISFFLKLIPGAILAPILIFVAMDIVAQAFFACPRRHAPAVVLAMFPSIARLISIQIENAVLVPAEHLKHIIAKAGETLPDALVSITLGNGFIVQAMLWGAFLAKMIDRRLKASSLYLAILALLTFFGVIHSASIDGRMYLPWTLSGTLRLVPYHFAIGYLALAVMMFLLSYTREAKSAPFKDEEFKDE